VKLTRAGQGRAPARRGAGRAGSKARCGARRRATGGGSVHVGEISGRLKLHVWIGFSSAMELTPKICCFEERSVPRANFFTSRSVIQPLLEHIKSTLVLQSTFFLAQTSYSATAGDALRRVKL
jgi:hypothetical protein